jgi:large subunit ribosomal protein L3
MATMFTRGILGTKLGMTRVFRADGEAIACTVVEAGPCKVVQRKTLADNGYEAVQIGFQPKREKLVTQPLKGHFDKAGTEPLRHIREVRFADGAEDVPAVGTTITCDIFAEGESVDVIGTMKGRGTTGVVKRHGFATLKESHGAHFFVRHAGSIGSRKPQHTRPGTRMAGRHGNSRVTVQNLEILRVDAAKNLLYVKGAVPGPNGGLLLLRTAKKQRRGGAPA